MPNLEDIGLVELHHQLRELANRLGTDVLADADNFRAALDDFLDEGAATRGQVHLLVDAIRLGAFARLMDRLDRGAPIEQATLDAGRWLAEERGTSDVTGSRWACAILAYAAGRFEHMPTESAAVTMRPAEKRLARSFIPNARTTQLEPPAPAHVEEFPMPGGDRQPHVAFQPASPAEPMAKDGVRQDRPTKARRAIWPVLGLGAGAGVSASTFLTYWSGAGLERDGWSYEGGGGARYGTVIVVFAVVLLLGSGWALARPSNPTAHAVGLVGAIGVATEGLIMAVEWEFWVEFADIGPGLVVLWGLSALSVVVAAAFIRRLAPFLASRPPPARVPLALVSLAISAFAVGTPFLAWWEFPGGSVDGWGRVTGNEGHWPRFGVLLALIATTSLLLALRLLRAGRLRPTWTVLGVVTASVGLAAAVFLPAVLAHVAIDEDSEGFGWGAWLLLPLAALCLTSLGLLLVRRSEAPPRAGLPGH